MDGCDLGVRNLADLLREWKCGLPVPPKPKNPRQPRVVGESLQFQKTDALPGTREKLDVLRGRWERGEPLWHDDDPVDWSASTNVVNHCEFNPSVPLVSEFIGYE